MKKTFLIRSLKQGSTGAVRTWPACEVLLDYLVRHGGLRDTEEKLNGSTADVSVLDLTLPCPPLRSVSSVDFMLHSPRTADGPTRNIVELGGGNGTLCVGLAMALNGSDDAKQKKTTFQPAARIMCTDHDHRTVKNMRFNVTQQPRECRLGKAVRAQSLDWGDAIGGDEFSSRVEDQFGEADDGINSNIAASADDPMLLITHVVGSDIHFGHTTLDPLSSVIAAFKLRNPQINVTIMIKERNPEQFADVSDLATEIELKVVKGLEDEDDDSTIGEELQDFSVSVRDVLHDEIENMKLLEC